MALNSSAIRGATSVASSSNWLIEPVIDTALAAYRPMTPSRSRSSMVSLG